METVRRRFTGAWRLAHATLSAWRAEGTHGPNEPIEFHGFLYYGVTPQMFGGADEARRRGDHHDRNTAEPRVRPRDTCQSAT